MATLRFFFGHFSEAAAAEGSGIATATGSATGEGYALHYGSGASAATASATGEGYAAHYGSGTANATAAAAGTGYAAHYGSGAATATAAAVGEGEQPSGANEGSGVATATASAVGEGYAAHYGSGAATATGSAQGAGYRLSYGSGEAHAVGAAVGAGSSGEGPIGRRHRRGRRPLWILDDVKKKSPRRLCARKPATSRSLSPQHPYTTCWRKRESSRKHRISLPQGSVRRSQPWWQSLSGEWPRSKTTKPLSFSSCEDVWN